MGGGDGDGVDKKIPSSPSADTLSAISSGADHASGDFVKLDVLDRLVKVAKELRESPNSAELIHAMEVQEETWKEKYKAEQATAAGALEKQKAEGYRVKGEEERKTIDAQTQHQNERSRYEDQVNRKRYEDQLKQQSHHAEQERQRNVQAQRALEEEKQRTYEYQEKLRRVTEIEKAKIEAAGRVEQERLNRDIRNEQLVMQAKEYRETVLEGIKAVGDTIGNGITSYLDNPKKILTSLGFVTGLALGVYGARSGVRVTSEFIAHRLSQPPLVRETSRTNPLTQPLKTIKKMFTKTSGDSLEGIILAPEVHQRMRDITIATAHTRRHGATYRNLMLYGPPGTGKTMFAKRLAQQSGLEYAVLAGGDVGPLGKTAVAELHKVFNWGESSSKGLLLFIDEADAFLRKRGQEGDGQMSEDLRNALSAFLFRTGTPSTKTMIVFATNEPAAFDRAVVDRVDEAVEFSMPGVLERTLLLEKYFKQLVVEGAPGARKIIIREDVPLDMAPLAERLEGFSGRQIMKFCNALQAAAYASVDNSLTGAILEHVVLLHQEQIVQKTIWEQTPLHRA